MEKRSSFLQKSLLHCFFVHSDQILCGSEYFNVLLMVKSTALLSRPLLHQLWYNISLLLFKSCQRLRRQEVTFHTLPLSLPDCDDLYLKSKEEL